MVDPYNITCTQTPLGLLSLYSVVSNSNIDAEICDLNYKYYKYYKKEMVCYNNFNDNMEIIVREILKNKTKIVSIYSMCNTYHMAILVGKLLKELSPTTKLILSGPHATLVAEETLKEFSFIYGFPNGTQGDVNDTMKLIHQIKKKNVLNKSITMNINILCLNFLPGTEISEQYYDELEYNRLDGMSYYKEEKIEPVIENLVKNHKSIFLHCYNLHVNTNLEQKYFGYTGF